MTQICVIWPKYVLCYVLYDTNIVLNVSGHITQMCSFVKDNL